MKLSNFIYQNTFFRGLDFIRGRKNIEKLKFLRKSQYWNKQQLEKWQLDKLNLLLEKARNDSVFYAEYLEKFQFPLNRLEDIQDLPILTKEDIRGNLERILCHNVPSHRLELARTGGSTGEPSFYYLDWNSKDWNRGSVYRSSEWAGAFLGDKTVQMSGSDFDLAEFNKMKNKIILWLQRYKNLPGVAACDETFENYFQILKKYKPTSIWGYSSSIFLFSQFIEQYHPEADFDFLKAIITSSETLRPEWREAINHTFKGEKVFDHYGSREAYIASECAEHNGYHIHADVILLEVVDREGRQLPSGELGRILITDLSNQSFPFIRYEIGDVGILAEPEKCACGVSLPKLQSVEGRISDILVFKNRTVTPHFNSIFIDSGKVLQYQVVQKQIDEITVRIVKSPKYTLDTELMIENNFKKIVGPGVLLTFDYVDDIPVSQSGKRRYVISEVEIP